jgi:hypothetical protein
VLTPHLAVGTIDLKHGMASLTQKADRSKQGHGAVKPVDGWC